MAAAHHTTRYRETRLEWLWI